MKIEYIKLGNDDMIIISHNVSSIPTSKVDDYCKPILETLVQVFGKDKVVLLPVREGETWEFVVVSRS